jgi:hypothetical protein
MRHKISKFVACVALAMSLCVVESYGEGEFVHLDWSRVDFSKNVPEYCNTISLGSNYGDYTYSARVLYPEFAELSRCEAEALSSLQADFGNDVKVETRLGVSRKEGFLDVVVVPVVKRDGKLLRLVSFKLQIDSVANQSAKSQAFAAKSAPAASSRYKAHSVLSEGKWVKIRVEKEGIYQLSKSFLAEMGFSDLSRVKVYGYGGRVQNHAISYGSYVNSDYDDLEEIPLYRRKDNVLFFAEGCVRWSNWTLASNKNPNGECYATHTNNTYSKYSYYFVTEGDSPLQMGTLESPQTTSQTVSTYPEHFVIDNDAYSWYTGGRTFYDSYDYAGGNSKNYTIETPDLVSDCTARVDVSFSAKANSVTTAQVSLGSQSLGTLSMSALATDYDKATTSDRTFLTQMSGNTSTLNITTTKGNAARLDYIRVCYRRRLKMNGDFLVFSHYLSSPSTMTLEGASSNTEVWRIGYPDNPVAKVAATLSGTTMTFSVENPTLRYVAVDLAATYPSPVNAGSIANQDLHADSVADMVIIIPESGKLEEQAQRLASFHESSDSLKVKVVRADLLYNEFSSGTPDAGAYRRYLKMLYDRNSGDSLPKYLLLFGGCVWDNRGVTSACASLNLKDYLLCYESEPSVSEVSCYVNEDYFGMLDDGEGASMRYDKVDLGIGRIPVTDASKAKIVVDKIIAYAANKNPGSWKNTVWFLADDGEKNKHMNAAEGVAKMVEKYYPNLKVGRIYWDAYNRVSTATGFTYPQVTTDIKTAMQKGALVMNYMGHGAPYCISKENVLKLADFKEFVCDKIPLWVVASCEISPFDREEESIGVESLLNPNGSAIAFYSSTRAVYSTQNSYINNYFMYYVLGKSKTGKRYTLGDANRLAKVNLVSSVEGEIMNNRDYGDNKLKYALLGDPALTIGMPTRTVVLDSINGEAIKTSALHNLSAGSMARFSGHIEDTDGTPLNGFNGQVTVTLYDCKDTITCHNNTNEDVDPLVYTTYDRMLFESNDSVRLGKFTVEMPVPLDIKYSGGLGMVNMYAVNADNTLEANGTSTSFTVNGTSEDIKSDSIGPELFIYLNSPDFKNGQTVNESPYFYAKLKDADGINITGNGVGHDLELIIDGKENTSYDLNTYYQNDFGSYTSGSVSYKIPTLTEGSHKLVFRAWDIKNNSSSASLDFVVKTGLSPQISSVSLSRNPASTSTAFQISYDRPEEEATITVNVYNCYGQKCWTHTESAISDGYYTISWDLAANNGVALASGVYIYEVKVSCNGGSEAVKRQKMIISRQ